MVYFKLPVSLSYFLFGRFISHLYFMNEPDSREPPIYLFSELLSRAFNNQQTKNVMSWIILNVPEMSSIKLAQMHSLILLFIPMKDWNFDSKAEFTYAKRRQDPIPVIKLSMHVGCILNVSLSMRTGQGA